MEPRSVKLVTYEYVPHGFEMVIDNTAGKIWNLWYNVQLTDDPEKWDNEIKAINKMQRTLGRLKLDHRLIRAQMAEFCRVHPLFPESVSLLCKEIGDEQIAESMEIGCEGRDLLGSLGYHNSASLKEQQRELLESYIRFLRKWLDEYPPESLHDSKVFGFLGAPIRAKRVWIENLIAVIDTHNPGLSSIQPLVEEACKKKDKNFLARAQKNYFGRPFNCFKCRESDKCGCMLFMLIDSGLLCVGTLDEKRSMLEAFSRFIQEHIISLSFAINSWLEGTSPRNIPKLNPSYFTQKQALETAHRVHHSLGEKNEVKVWLAACLLKTLKSNQRWHKTAELIDRFPEATSWLERALTSRSSSTKQGWQ